MLQSLYIRNYAIIQELELELSSNLTTITGETGAGKSILLGALSLILGKRADTSVLYSEDEKCIVEGQFQIDAYDLKYFFEENDLDYAATTVVRREINNQGKSRAFINDTPVNLTVLKTFASKVIDLHQQHETLDIATDDVQLQVIDSMAGSGPDLAKYKETFREYRKARKKLSELQNTQQQSQQDLDYFQFQLAELEQAQLSKDESQEALEDELDTLTHAEAIKSALANAAQGLDGEEVSVTNLLEQLIQELKGVEQYNTAVKELNERLRSGLIELRDVHSEMEDLDADLTVDEERLLEVQNRLDLIYKLQKKHGVTTIQELCELEEELADKVANSANLDERIASQEKVVGKLETELTSKALTLSKARKEAIETFRESVNAQLPNVGLPNASVTVERESLEEFSVTGLDKITFLFTANPGAKPLPIRKVASGGELSRLMLIIKSLVAASTALPTLIFDEIDTGISGEIGLKVGSLLKKLARNHQVVCITHLPQIASKGDTHYFVFKDVQNGRTYTHVKTLEREERTTEIARMLSGENPTEAALANARDLLGGRGIR